MWLTFSIAASLVSIVVSVKTESLASWYPSDANKHMNFTTKCFGDLGCFYTGPPWYHPLYRPVTVPPQETHAKFLLYTRSNENKPYYLKPMPKSLTESPYKDHLPLKVLVHGYQDKPTSFMGIMKEFLKHYKYNVIIVDWSHGSRPPLYQAIANARLVAAYTAKMLHIIMSQTGLKAEDIHIIGHSLGSQLCGFIGERMHNLGRITGLDPAGPYFENAPRQVRLDRGDAIFVDEVLTNSGDSAYTGLSSDRVVGHAVFTVNNGNHQPGCDHKSILPLVGKYDKNRVPNLCSHRRALEIFLSSINSCHYKSYACFSYDGFRAGMCKDTPYTNRMGYHAVKPPYQLNYYLNTTSHAPYCEPK